MNRIERERVSVVAEDLHFLREEWDKEATDSSLRRSSAVLRRLLVDNDFGQAWRAVGLPKGPLVKAVEMSAVINNRPIQSVEFAHAGTVTHKGMMVFGAAVYNRALSPAEIRKGFQGGPDYEGRKMALKRFLEGAIIIVKGTRIDRRELILYVSNKLGGAHFDARRRDSNPLEKKFRLLDTLREEEMVVADKDAIYLSLLSIGQNVAEAEDVGKFLARCRDL